MLFFFSTVHFDYNRTRKSHAQKYPIQMITYVLVRSSHMITREPPLSVSQARIEGSRTSSVRRSWKPALPSFFYMTLCLRDSNNKMVIFHQRNVGYTKMKTMVMHLKKGCKVGILCDDVFWQQDPSLSTWWTGASAFTLPEG